MRFYLIIAFEETYITNIDRYHILISRKTKFSNMDSLTRYGVDPIKAIDINGQADKKVKELIDKFDEKCDCRAKTKGWEPPIPTEKM